jgi:predicted transcriptional regulator of viral defense system
MSEIQNYGQFKGLQLLEKAIQQFGPLFTIQQVATIAGEGMTRSQLRWYLSALIRSGRLEKIKRGSYALKNPPPGMEIHPFAVANALIQPAAISHWSALAHYGFTTQLPRMVQVSTPSKVVTPAMRRGMTHRPRGRTTWKAAGVEVEIIHIQPRAFFGLQKIWVSSWHQVMITDPERTALDLIARQEVFGGLSAGLDLLEAILPQIEVERLVGYGMEYQVAAVIKRLGWCLETLGISRDLLGLLQQVPMNNVSRLDPRMPASATVNDRWQVNENIRNP